MAKKHVNQNKGASFQKSKGRRGGAAPQTNSNGRQRNVGHSNSEEHSRKAKGNKGSKGGFLGGLFG